MPRLEQRQRPGKVVAARRRRADAEEPGEPAGGNASGGDDRQTRRRDGSKNDGGESLSGLAGVSRSRRGCITANAGAQVSRPVTAAASLFVRGDVTVYGDRFFDEFNVVSQDTYSLTNLQFGIRGARLFGEGWVRNAFDARYVALALAYPGLAPSGYLGEPGAPRTFGVRVGMTF